MKKNFLLLMIVVVFGYSAFGQEKSFDELTFNLTALKSQVLLMEPIPFKLTLTNNTDSPITVEASLSFHVSYVSLEIRKPNGTIVTPSQLSYLRGRTFVFPKELRTSESMEATQLFEFKAQNYFGKVGEYQVRATLNNKDGKLVRSEWADLTIAEPIGMDKNAYEYLLKKLDKHSSNFVPFVAWDTDELEEFVLQHPGTTYADYARYSLGERYFEREKEKAEAQLRQIKDSNFFYAKEVGEKLKKLERQLKNKN